MYHYQVEYQDDDDKTHVETYGGRKSSAISRARHMSKKHMLAYVVSCKTRRDGSSESCGHKSFGQGSVIETDGEGF